MESLTFVLTLLYFAIINIINYIYIGHKYLRIMCMKQNI